MKVVKLGSTGKGFETLKQLVYKTIQDTLEHIDISHEIERVSKTLKPKDRELFLEIAGATVVGIAEDTDAMEEIKSRS